MPARFSLTIQTIKRVSKLPGAWTPEQCLALLEKLEFEDVGELSPDQASEYATMALQDLDCTDAARALLDFLFEDRLSAGKKQNASEEMEAERLWEEYPDLGCHETLFNAQVMLHEAFSQVQTPEINRIELTLRPLDKVAENALSKTLASKQAEALLTRCLAAVSPESSILNRLFEDQIAGQPFSDAEHLVWQVSAGEVSSANLKRDGAKLSLYSPIRWTEDLEEGDYECLLFVEED